MQKAKRKSDDLLLRFAFCILPLLAQAACKPSSVSRPGREDGHLSRRRVATALKQPARWLPGQLTAPYLALLRVGFARPDGHPPPGALLPHHFTLTLGAMSDEL